MTDVPDPSRRPEESSHWDPVLVHARRELVVIVSSFAICCLWSVGTCYSLGFGTSGDALETVLGMPAWVFWGIVVPWLACDVFTLWFCFAFMADDPLGEKEEEEQAAETAAGGNSAELDDTGAPSA